MKDYAYNKRASFDFELLETFEAGIALVGAEVKSVRAGHMSLRGAFVTVHNGSVVLTNATIPPWQVANTFASYDPTRPRKLLLKSSELKYLIGKMSTQGLTVVPVRVYPKRSVIKLEIALAKGKKKFNKKEKKKEQDIKRDVQRMIRGKE
jgi:SsrA-binding protein